MKTKTIIYIIIILAVTGGIVAFVAWQPTPGATPAVPAAAPSQPTASATTGAVPPAAPVGSVAGVDLSEFENQANQSAALANQDGTADAQAISNDGSLINSSTDSVTNPIQ